jgi:hypothetical protein
LFRPVSLLPADTVECAQVDQDVDECVLVGDGQSIAQFRALNAQGDGLRVEAFGSGALAVNLFVQAAVVVELIADASAVTGKGGGAIARTWVAHLCTWIASILLPFHQLWPPILDGPCSRWYDIDSL